MSFKPHITHDSLGNEYAKFAELKPGQTIWLDKGFTCRKPGPTKLQADNGELYFQCAAGQHFLEGQLDGGHLIGIYAQEPKSI